MHKCRVHPWQKVDKQQLYVQMRGVGRFHVKKKCEHCDYFHFLRAIKRESSTQNEKVKGILKP